ncbi:MAG: rRNA maturation RNase YbeY [Firmicutes bacterium]|nr:rRNA maturation RNase YbeY [Alicyclobacillaceae bacterium]MCL6496934.1 rRNA maturation RNase YbeY [Bacillota bacterium]
MEVWVESHPEHRYGEWEDTVRQAVRQVLVNHGGMDDIEVCVVLTDDHEVRRLNREYRGIDAPTDVLSFSQREGEDGFDPGPLLGDVVISMDRARAQAEEFGHSLAREVAFLAVHGALHLLGYDHATPQAEREMMAQAEAVLAGLGLTREAR